MLIPAFSMSGGYVTVLVSALFYFTSQTKRQKCMLLRNLFWNSSSRSDIDSL